MNKYNAKKAIVDGITFDSKAEADFYIYLVMMKSKGLIENFELQPSYELIPPFERHGKKYRSMTYTADFLVYHLNGATEAIDIKGMITDRTVVKVKLFRYVNDTKLTLLKKYRGLWVNAEGNKKGKDKEYWRIDYV